MKHYAGSLLEEERGVRWYFLTTRSVGDLLPQTIMGDIKTLLMEGGDPDPPR